MGYTAAKRRQARSRTERLRYAIRLHHAVIPVNTGIQGSSDPALNPVIHGCRFRIPLRARGMTVELACRPRGLPIGNLTSQFFSNCFLHPFDQFVTRELRCPAYLRYVDDIALFSDSKRELLAWKRAIIERLAQLRLVIHEAAAQAMPVSCGIPWLGFVVYPTHRRVKARKVRTATRRLGERVDAYHARQIAFGALDASVKGWVNHVRYADSWGLRQHVFDRLSLRDGSATDVPNLA